MCADTHKFSAQSHIQHMIIIYIFALGT